MIRVIRFRGKDLIHGKWIYGGIAFDRKDNAVILPDNDWSKGGVVDKNTISQFSGAKDKDQTDIYERDIVRSERDGELYLIEFRSGMFYASIIKKNVYGGFPLHVLTDNEDPEFRCKIVGNIYDNPELG